MKPQSKTKVVLTLKHFSTFLKKKFRFQINKAKAKAKKLVTQKFLNLPTGITFFFYIGLVTS